MIHSSLCQKKKHRWILQYIFRDDDNRILYVDNALNICIGLHRYMWYVVKWSGYGVSLSEIKVPWDLTALQMFIQPGYCTRHKQEPPCLLTGLFISVFKELGMKSIGISSPTSVKSINEYNN